MRVSKAQRPVLQSLNIQFVFDRFKRERAVPAPSLTTHYRIDGRLSSLESRLKRRFVHPLFSLHTRDIGNTNRLTS